MYITQNNTLTIPRGDTAEISIQLIDELTSEPYMLDADEYAEFDIFSVRGIDPIVTRTAGGTAQEADGTIKIMLKSSDTAQLNGTYKYMARVVNTTKQTVDTVVGLENDAYINVR